MLKLSKKNKEPDHCTQIQHFTEGLSVGLIVFISTLYRNQLVSTDACNENMVSYGVRNSIAAYLSFAGDQDPSRVKSDNRKKKSKSLYVLPENGLPNTDYDEDF